MPHDYEFWSTDGGYCCLGVPHPNRGQVLNEPGATLLLRFRASSVNEARKVRDRFWYGGNPDGFEELNIPASEFTIQRYACGLIAGDLLCLTDSNSLGRIDPQSASYLNGTEFNVIQGDTDFPDVMWAHVSKSIDINHPVGQFASFPVSDELIQCFERIHH